MRRSPDGLTTASDIPVLNTALGHHAQTELWGEQAGADKTLVVRVDVSRCRRLCAALHELERFVGEPVRGVPANIDLASQVGLARAAVHHAPGVRVAGKQRPALVQQALRLISAGLLIRVVVAARPQLGDLRLRNPRAEMRLHAVATSSAAWPSVAQLVTLGMQSTSCRMAGHA